MIQNMYKIIILIFKILQNLIIIVRIFKNKYVFFFILNVFDFERLGRASKPQLANRCTYIVTVMTYLYNNFNQNILNLLRFLFYWTRFNNSIKIFLRYVYYYFNHTYVTYYYI